MRQEILDIIEKHPRHYTRLIRNNPALSGWVVSKNQTPTNHWPTMIYSAVNDANGTCQFGNTRKVVRFNQGFSGCGPANSCRCVKKSISDSVKHAKQKHSADQVADSNHKRRNTMIAKYGVAHNSQREDIKHVWQKPKISDEAFRLLKDREWVIENYVTNQRTLTDLADELGIYYGTVGDYIRQHNVDIRRTSNYSMCERSVSQALVELGYQVELNNWSILGDNELDIVLPNHNLAIEVNGLYWHSYHPNSKIPENRHRHIAKTKLAEQKGIRLIQVTDWEWVQKSEIILSIVNSATNRNKKIYARNCIVEQVGAKDARKFYNENHMQGFAAAKQHWGLTHGSELVMCVSVGRNRFTQDSELELVRVASKINCTVVGGLSRLLKSIGQPVLSYCNLDKFTGSGYKNAGFEFVKYTGPGYCWTDGTQPISRYRCQKAKLPNWLPSFDASKSESENLFDAGYRRYWDCGNAVFEWKQP